MASSSFPKLDRFVRFLTTLSILLGLFAPLARISTASAASITSATLSGGSGTVTVSGMLFAKNGGNLTLDVVTSSDTRCVEVGGAHTGRQTSATGTSSWRFTFTAGTGDGLRTLNVTAGEGSNNNGCTTRLHSTSVSYTLDNTAPVVTGALSPAPNAQGWNNSSVTLTWSATDAGSGVASGPQPSSQNISGNTAGTTHTSSATDRLGHSGTGSLTVKLDRNNPSISGSRSPAPNSYGWNNSDVTVSFTCSDLLSGIKSCTGATTLSSNGSNQSVTGTAVDNADNSATDSVGGINIDKVAPQLSGTPTSAPNSAGWYRSDVTIAWSCSDALSGIDGSCPPSSTIGGEGTGLTASASVRDRAGNTASATSPAVNIDRTAPSTLPTAPEGWNNNDVNVELAAFDNLSGVQRTYYVLNGGPTEEGTRLRVRGEGIHRLEFWSVDVAGNSESRKSIEIRIDRTRPTISHTQSPEANGNGWNNSAVTVTFVCADDLSGIASCTGPRTVTTEGREQLVEGVAVDNAGNRAVDPAMVNIDLTAPTISAAADRPANEAGWYSSEVLVHFSCSDALSGIDHCPEAQRLGEGADQSARGEARDAAGNSASAEVSGLNVDLTAPRLDGAPTTAPGGNGWYREDVTVAWSCEDGLSGIDGACPAASTVTGEGDNLSTSASVRDRAGNVANATVTGIKIDRSAPSTTASLPVSLASGWYADSVEVTLEATDSLSGVAATYYRVDDGAPQSYHGPFNFDQNGRHTISFWSVDEAGNIEGADGSPASITLQVDGNAPTINGSRSAANSYGWNNGPVQVSFTCADEESGLVHCGPDVLLEQEGENQSATGHATDNVGKRSQSTVSGINIDLTPPLITGTLTPPANADGWSRGPVTVHFTCSDALSGIASCPEAQLLTASGRGLQVSGEAVDRAGNRASTTLREINIDAQGPVITLRNIANGARYTLGAVPTAGCSATDELSGLSGSCQVSVTGGTPNGVGTFNFVATATDRAGNTTESRGSYRVIYRWDGFLQPINDTAHQVGSTTSIFRAGSTIPVKIYLKRADGTVVEANTPPVWITPRRGSSTSAPVDESAYSDTPTAGSSFQYDSLNRHYYYKWGTSRTQAGYFWQMAVMLDDGQVYTVNIGLR